MTKSSVTLHATRLALTAAVACFAVSTVARPAKAAGELTNSWRTADGWLTEQRMHPGGAKVCSTGKAGTVPHQFGLSIIRSGQENLLMIVDQQQPPTAAGDMTFMQKGLTVGTLSTQVTGPGFASVNPNGRQTPELLAKLGPGALTISVAGRQYQADMSGLPDALAQLSSCAAGS